MNSVMLGLMLSGWEILILLLVLLVVAGLAMGAILLVVWLTRRRPQETPAPPPVQRPEPPKPVPSICPRCGTPLPADSPQGLCPRCVMGVGLATHTETGEALGPNGTKIVKPPAPACEEVARYFPHLEILECLGRGGMGVVYKARQPKLNRLVALKILAPEKGADPKFAERFLREAQALARLNHPNIVTVHDFGEADGMFYLLMEYVDGVTLRELLREGRMKPEQALAIVPKICEALQFAHEQGIVHRDIKPENVLLDKQGRVKIADFGIAKIVEARDASPRRPGEDERTAGPAVATNLTQDQVLGTPHYMAPEQVEHPQSVDHRADIYSLGVVFYEMLTGELPLGKFQPPSKKVQVDVRLDEVVLHALEKEPERRYQHASEVKSDVETIAQSPPPPSAPANGPEMVRRLQLLRWKSTSFFVAAGGFLVAALLFAASGVTIAVLLNLAGLVAYGIAGYRIRQRAGDLEVTIRGLPSGMKDLDFGPPPVATMLNAIVVGTRNGRRVINWPGVIPAWLLLSILISFVFWGLCRLVGMQLSLWASAAYGLVCSSIVVGSGVARSWSLPKDKLMPLDDAAPAGPIAAAPSVNESVLAKAREEVKNPASWLVATGILNWIAIPTVLGILAVETTSQMKSGRPVGGGLPLLMTVPILALFLSSAMILAGLKMKRLEAYSLAVLGSILAIFITPGNLIGLPVGIWCLVTLFRRDVREAFGKARLLLAENARPKGGGVGWLAAAGVCGLALLVWGATSARILQHGLRSARLTAVPPADARSPYPKAAHISTNNLSVLIYHDDVDLHYALFHADKFSTSIANSSMGGKSWLDQGGVTLVNQRTFGFRRESSNPEGLNVNGREFDLHAGRVLVLHDDGAVEQRALFPSLAVAKNPEQLAKLIHEQRPSPVTTIVTTVNGSAGSGTTFGPVIERVVNDDEVKRDFFIDLDTGKLFSAPQGLNFSDTNAFAAWLRTNGIDAMGETSVSVRGLMGMEMIVRPLAGPQWESLKPEDALANEVLQQGTPRSPVFLSAKGELPETFLFKTRECGVGLLQITGFTENPRGVKIRYKLVRPLVPRADLDQDIPLARALEESKAIFPDGPPLTEEEVIAAVRAIKIHHPDIPDAAYQVYQRVVNERVLPRGMYFDRVRGWNPGNARYDVDWRDLTLDFDRAGIKGHPPGMIFNYRVRARFLGSGPRGPSDERPMQTSSTALGPGVERVLYSVATQRPIKGEDLDSGREIEVPAELEKAGEDQFFHWLATHGVDLLAFGDQQHWALWTSLHLASVSAATWERPVTADLLAALKSGAVGLERAEPDVKEGFVSYRLSTNAGFPLTYAFQSSAGCVGVLQISGLTDSPRGVKIRYKLVQGASGAATPSPVPANTNTAQVRWLESNHLLGVYRWRVERSAPSQLLYGIIDVTDARQTNTVLTAVDPAFGPHIPFPRKADYTLRLEHQNGKLRLLVEWHDPDRQNDGNKALSAAVDCGDLAELRVAVRNETGTLDSEHYQVLAEIDAVFQAGSFAWVKPRLQFVMRLVQPGAPVGRELLGAADSVRSVAAGRLSRKRVALASPDRYGELAFGPVVERVLSFTGTNAFLDLDTGKVWSPEPGDPPLSTEQLVKWAVHRGIDVAGNRSENDRGLIGFDLVAVPTPSKDWDNEGSLVPAVKAIWNRDPGTVVHLSVGETLPATFLFQTRQGGLGALQITGFTDKPRGVKIRYKLAQSSEAPTAKESPPAPSASTVELTPSQKARANEMRQVLIAATMYADNHQGSWPEQISELRRYLSESLAKSAGNSFEYRQPVLRGTATNTNVPMPSQTPVLFEKTPASAEGQWIGFADGHVEFVKDGARLQKLRVAFPDAERAAASASDQSALQWTELSHALERLIAGQPARTGYDIEIWEKVPGVAGEYRIRADVQQFELKPPTPEISLPRGKVYFLPASNRFYVQWDSPLASTLHYYGPFAGDPIKMLGLATPDSAR